MLELTYNQHFKTPIHKDLEFQMDNQKLFLNHISSSVEDLMLLFETEKTYLKILLAKKENNIENINDTTYIEDYLKLIDYDM